MTSIVINDCFDDLNTEKIRLKNELKEIRRDIHKLVKIEDIPEDNDHAQFEQNTKEFPFKRNNKTKLIYDKLVFKCLINNCDKHFESLSLLSTHQKDSHKSNRLIKNQSYERCYKCDYPSCGQLFRWGPKSIREHLLSCHSGRPQIICDFAKTKEVLEEHNGIDKDLTRVTDICYNSTEPRIRCNFPECDKTFRTKKSLRIHKRYVHSTDRPFVCDVEECGKRFKRKVSLRLHKKIHRNKPRICSVDRSSSLANDYNKEETNSVPIENHSNPVVDRIEDTPKNKDHAQFRKHLKTLPYEPEYESQLIYDKLVFNCLINNCDKHFESLTLLSTHQKDSHKSYCLIKHENYERRFKCVFPGCGQLFHYGPHRARNHILASHSEGPQFKCDFPECDKRFRTKHGMQLHQVLHKDIPFLKCDFFNCDFVSKYKRFIERHKRNVHSTDRQFVCDDKDCDKRSKTKGSLERHQLITKNVPQITCPIEGSPSVVADGYNNQMTDTIPTANHSNQMVDRMENTPEDDDHGRFEQHIKALPYEPEYKSQLIYDKLVFKCLINNCDKHFESLSLLSTHQKDSHKSYCLIKNENYERCYKCVFPGCGQLFRWGPYRAREHIMAIHSAEPQFKCDFPECEKRFRIKHGLQLHQVLHKNIPFLKCNINGCAFVSKYKRSIERHKQCVHSTPMFVCDDEDCGKRFTTNESLERHKLITKNVSRIECPIEGCPRIVRKCYLQRHISRHSKVEVFACDWKGCHFKSKYKKNLETHKISVHSSERNYMCVWPECPKSFKTSTAVSSHMRLHTTDKNVMCEWPGCEYKSRYTENMKVHFRRHTNEKPYVCQWPGCEYRAATNCTLKIHMRVHRNKGQPIDKTFMCKWPGCESRFALYTTLYTHRQSVHSTQLNYSCDWPQCDKRFKIWPSLYNHKKSHYSRKSVKRHVCDWPGCEYRSSSKPVLVTHFRTHTNERPFACEWPGCEYRCAHKSNLKTHFKVHQKN